MGSESLLRQRSRTPTRTWRRGGLSVRRYDPLTEWTASPLGRLGRPLLVEIETYLEFFAIAGYTVPDPPDTT